MRLNKVGKNDLIKMKYYYSFDMKVQKIEEYSNAKWMVLWDRTKRENEIVDEILDLMKVAYTKQQIIDFINTLPLEIKSRFTYECVKIA